MGRCGNLVSFSSATIKLRELRTNRRRDWKQHPHVPGVLCRCQGKSHSLYFTALFTSADHRSPPPAEREPGTLPPACPNLRRRTAAERIYGVNMSGATKGKQIQGTKVTEMEGHRVPTAAEGGGGTSASVVNENDQSLLFNKGTESLKCCFMWIGPGFGACC